jgi:hypothetical protein
VASTATGQVIHSDNWWAGNTIAIGSPVGNQTGNSLTGGECENILPPGGTVDCDDDLIDDPIFTQGVVFCEFDEAGLEPAQGGYGGRCTSAKQAGVPASAPAFDDWIVMNVTADSDSTCNPAWKTDDAKYFTRVGNNVHGLEVEGGDSLFYRDLLAYWISSGHVTYFLDVADAQENGGELLGCFGADTHEADTTIATNVAAACNSTDPDDAVDPFDPTSYIVGAPGDEQTVCTA